MSPRRIKTGTPETIRHIFLSEIPRTLSCHALFIIGDSQKQRKNEKEAHSRRHWKIDHLESEGCKSKTPLARVVGRSGLTANQPTALMNLKRSWGSHTYSVVLREKGEGVVVMMIGTCKCWRQSPLRIFVRLVTSVGSGWRGRDPRTLSCSYLLTPHRCSKRPQTTYTNKNIHTHTAHTPRSVHMKTNKQTNIHQHDSGSWEGGSSYNACNTVMRLPD
jgi:hypothetical protein